jgi:thiol-disulfide isomerase/thioredoxin
MKQAALIIIAAAIALAAGISVRRLSTPVMDSRPSTLIDFSLPDVSGVQRNVSEWQGKVLVINFWATWCPPCRKEIPEFVALQEQYGDKGLQFVGIAIEEREPVSEYLNTIKINYPILIGGDKGIALAQQLGNIINAVPFTIVVNRQGQIIHRQPGEFSREKILETIRPLMR